MSLCAVLQNKTMICYTLAFILRNKISGVANPIYVLKKLQLKLIKK